MKTENWDPATYDAPRRRLVPCYDAFYGTVAELVARWGGERPSLLDVGAGTGLLTAEIADRVSLGSVTLWDASAAMLERAQNRLRTLRPRIVQSDFNSEFPSGTYDVVVSSLAIHHLDDDGKRSLYARIFEQLRPGGLFVNAEQVSHPEPAAQKVYEATHLDYARN